MHSLRLKVSFDPADPAEYLAPQFMPNEQQSWLLEVDRLIPFTVPLLLPNLCYRSLL
jgi:hypothetical protein